MSVKVSMTVNGKPVTADVEPRTLLVDFIRAQLRLTGTHVGCDTAQCGACTIHMNGKAVKSCNILAMQAEGADIVTIEGIAKPTARCIRCRRRSARITACSAASARPGMVMSAIDLARNNANLTEETIRAGLDGNLCRCTGYHNIVKAVQAGAQAMK